MLRLSAADPRRLDFFDKLLLYAPPLLFAMVAHEYAHGYAAKKQGDLTAYNAGRLTLNPLKHIDPFMTVILPLMLMWIGGPIFGGAKPVPVNPANYRDLRRGDIIVSLAGVATNVAIAIISIPVVILLGLLGSALPGAAGFLGVLQYMMAFGILLNLFLAAFNLLPIPPLDGSHVFKYLLPPQWGRAYEQAARYGLFILYGVLLFAPRILYAWLSPVYLLYGLAQSLYAPFMLPNPFLN